MVRGMMTSAVSLQVDTRIRASQAIRIIIHAPDSPNTRYTTSALPFLPRVGVFMGQSRGLGGA